MKCAVIARHRAEFPLTLMCRVLGIARSAFYAWARREPSARAQDDARWRLEMTARHRHSRGTYGSPRLTDELQEHVGPVSRRRVARLRGELGLAGTPPTKWVVTTQAEAALPVAPNHLARQFTVGKPNRVWAADITYCWTSEGWLYLAVVLDLCSRRVVGWATHTTLERVLVETALTRALAIRQPGPGLRHHSDRGSQFARHDYQALWRTRHIVCSRSRRGDCWDNAVVESFFATLKRELVARQHWATRGLLQRALADYIDHWYNSERRHSTLGYLSPMAFELLQRQVA